MSKNTKRYLMLLLAVGLIAVAAGGSSGTFAGFNAQVTNAGNVFATGTLFLHGTKQAGNICRSEDNGSNVNATCEVLLNSLGHKAGDTDSANIELTNAGSIDATSLTLASTCDDTVRPSIATASTYAAGTYTSGSPLTLTLTSLSQPLVKGTDLVLFDGTNTDTVTVKTTVPAGPGTVDVYDTAGPLTGGTGPVAVRIAASFGSGALCNTVSGVQFYVQETNSSYVPNGQCAYPVDLSNPCSFTTAPTLGTAALATHTLAGSLNAGASRYYTVGVKMPTTLLNAGQNSQAKFDLTWQIAQ